MSRKTLIAFAFAAVAAAPFAQAGTLNITFDNIAEQTGEIRLGVYDAAGYDNGDSLTGADVTVDGATVTVSIDGLAPGEYGLKIYHDVDGNGEMRTNPFGMPTEPYAFSNNAKGRFGPPSWDAAKFEVTEDGADQTISIN
ncbi:DUF2141 domain-containing protein [Henriciella litoralis]|uniref:DUF2141 domain-containing protein n=1 Tax=Henriciella litoralis TaxID=568102 RepID=UPI00111C525F|nr:DUF2141 domain-containing protein [Henriciella litoralis]